MSDQISLLIGDISMPCRDDIGAYFPTSESIGD